MNIVQTEVTLRELKRLVLIANNRGQPTTPEELWTDTAVILTLCYMRINICRRSCVSHLRSSFAAVSSSLEAPRGVSVFVSGIRWRLFIDNELNYTRSIAKLKQLHVILHFVIISCIQVHSPYLFSSTFHIHLSFSFRISDSPFLFQILEAK